MKMIISIGIILLIICLALSGCNGSTAIAAEKLDTIPEKYVTISDEQMKKQRY